MGQPVVHFEIGCKDKARSEAFFTGLFGWKLTPAGPASLIDTGGGGINGHLTSLGHEPHRYVTVYAQVDDLGAYLTKAEALGGKRLVGPVDLPTGSFAWLADPDENIIGLWKPRPPEAKEEGAS
jgi:predicted enzyme related to lactoylglutathione lyase